MQVLIGNPHAVDTHYEGAALITTDLGLGERVTQVVLPDGIETIEAFKTLKSLISSHVHESARPAWVEIMPVDPELQVLLADEWHLPRGGLRKPQGWGDPNFKIKGSVPAAQESEDT